MINHEEVTEAYLELQKALANTEQGKNKHNRELIIHNIGEAMIIGAQDDTPRI